MKKTLLILVAAVASAGNSQAAQEYPSMIKSIFVQNCAKENPKNTSFCQCTIDGVEKSIAVDQFISDLQKFTDKIWEAPGYADIYKACLPKKSN